MNRRGFMGTILALGAAPAIVKAGSLMPIVVPDRRIIRFRRWEPQFQDITRTFDEFLREGEIGRIDNFRIATTGLTLEFSNDQEHWFAKHSNQPLPRYMRARIVDESEALIRRPMLVKIDVGQELRGLA